MNKKTKTAIAVGVVAIAGYLIYRQSQKKAFANLIKSRISSAPAGVTLVPKCMQSPEKGSTLNAADGSGVYYECCKQGVFGKIKATKDCSGAAIGGTTASVFTF
jgi:hypothetical protein